MADFSKGAILKIELENFMTYDNVKYTPGPHVNFILGRNGSGKSSIVSAIALCCGSSPSFIGRASTLADFIKHGKDSASVKLTLANPGRRPITIARVLRRGKNAHNECYFNEDRVPWENYLTEVRKLDIMTDNLVQFLPQERVIDFAAMDKIQLLEATERTIGQHDLYKMHEQLKEAGSTWQGATFEIDKMRKALTDAKDKEAQLMHEVDQLKQWETISLEMNLAIIKRDRQALVQEQKELRDRKKVLKQLDKDAHSLADKVVPFQNKVSTDKKGFLKIRTDLVANKKAVQKFVDDGKKEIERYNAVADKLQNDNLHEFDGLTRLKSQNEKRVDTINRNQTAINGLQAASTQFDDTQIQANIAEVTQRRAAAMAEVGKWNAEKTSFSEKARRTNEQITVKSEELVKLKNAEDGLTKFFAEQQHAGVAAAARKFVEENRARFRGAVYGPLISEITMKEKNQRHASIVESIIPGDLRFMFICENNDDVDYLMREMVRNRRIKVPIKLMNPENPRLSQGSNQIQREMKMHLKPQAFVSELFDAPAPVYRYLCNRFRMQTIPIFEAYSMELVERFKQVAPRFIEGNQQLSMFAGNTTWKFRKTRFSSSLAATSLELRDSMILVKLMNVNRGRPDTSALEREVEELKRKLEHFRQKENEANAEIESVKQKAQSITAELQRLNSFLNEKNKNQNKIKDYQREIADLEKLVSKFDPAAEEKKIASKIRQRNLDTMKNLTRREVLLSEKPPLLESSAKISCTYVTTAFDLVKRSKKLRCYNEALQKAWLSLVKEWKKHSSLMQIHRANQRKHKELFKAVNEDGRTNLTTDQEEAYSDLPEDNEQLRELIKSRRMQISASGQANFNAKEELEKHKKATLKLQETIATKTEDMNRKKKSLAATKKTWLDSINKLVSQIGTAFSSFYRGMNLAGDVTLDSPDNPDHFEKYGINIKVSYRPNRPLETLSASVHSGGEKSVATALYMLAIQELTKCPFRVVDEINQGMDAENERRVFKNIVATASRCGGQYFILSPKLLPDLHLTGGVTVSIIYSGEYMHSGKRLEDWDLDVICKRAKSMAGGSQRSVAQASQSQVVPQSGIGSSQGSDSSPGQNRNPKRALEDEVPEEELLRSPAKKRAGEGAGKLVRKLSTKN